MRRERLVPDHTRTFRPPAPRADGRIAPEPYARWRGAAAEASRMPGTASGCPVDLLAADQRRGELSSTGSRGCDRPPRAVRASIHSRSESAGRDADAADVPHIAGSPARRAPRSYSGLPPGPRPAEPAAQRRSVGAPSPHPWRQADPARVLPPCRDPRIRLLRSRFRRRRGRAGDLRRARTLVFRPFALHLLLGLRRHET